MSELNELQITISWKMASYQPNEELDLNKLCLHMDHVLRQYFREFAILSDLQVQTAEFDK
jgi:hypothetical protein